MNNIEIYIDGVDYSPYVVSPLKMGDLLDEQLDELNVTLKYIEKEYFEPLMSVKIVIKNSPEAAASEEMLADILSRSDYEFTGEKSTDGHLTASISDKKITQTYTKYFIVASDNAVAVPAFSERYIIIGGGNVETARFTHELYLIERTKFMEGFIGDNLTFTNPTEKNYDLTSNAIFVGYAPQDWDFSDKSIESNFYKSHYAGRVEFQTTESMFENIDKAFPRSFLYTYKPANSRSFSVSLWGQDNPDKKLALQQIIISGINYKYSQIVYYYYDSSNETEWLQRETDNNGSIKKHRIRATDSAQMDLISPTPTLSDGIYSVEHKFVLCITEENGPYEDPTKNYMGTKNLMISVTEQKQPPKRWTITDVVNRICDTLESNRSENRFSFDETQAAKYDKIIAPEFTFTNMNLREMLREVGGFIHAEPRLKDDTENNVIMFDEYGGFNQSQIGARNYIGYQLKSDINDWCTSIDSSAQNLVNQLDYASGTAYEPTRSIVSGVSFGQNTLGTSLRTETVTARFSQDDNTVIPTYLSISQIKRLRCVYTIGKGNLNIDITPYVYESADYNGLLKSTNGVYPYAKSCAVYYTQGEKNIKGLFYKESNTVSPYLSDFSIVNILRMASGDFTIDEQGVNLYYLNFVIEYVPIYSTRIRSIKPTLKTGVAPRTIAYNQGSNLIETRYYGENLKGVVARLGNIEKTYTYNLCYLSDIPKVGYLFDDNYYISAVYTEILPTYIKCTIGLSKDFNRLSQYVGISSNRRMWEVSEKQSQERQSVYTEYLKVSFSRDSDRGTCFSDLGVNRLISHYAASAAVPVNSAHVVTKTKNKTKIADLLMPCVASCFGNSIVFTFEFADNYSAGEKMIEGQIDGAYALFGQYVPYGDYYGKFYYMDIEFAACVSSTYKDWNGNVLPENVKAATIGNKSDPSLKPVTIENWKYRKDNREIPQISYELTAYSDDEDLIVGSALMGNSPYVTQPKALYLYGFPHRLNKLSSAPDLSKGTKINELTITQFVGRRLDLPITSNTQEIETYKSFALITAPSDETISVSDDDGNVTTQTIKRGGELYLGINKTYAELGDNPNIYFSVKKSI